MNKTKIITIILVIVSISIFISLGVHFQNWLISHREKKEVELEEIYQQVIDDGIKQGINQTKIAIWNNIKSLGEVRIDYIFKNGTTSLFLIEKTIK